jgi:hypothetical protein
LEDLLVHGADPCVVPSKSLGNESGESEGKVVLHVGRRRMDLTKDRTTNEATERTIDLKRSNDRTALSSIERVELMSLFEQELLRSLYKNDA